MPTWQNKRAARGHPANRYKLLQQEQQIAVLKRRREQRDKKRMALPPPPYPPDRRPGQDAGYIEIHDAIAGWTMRFGLAVPSDSPTRHARVDSRTLMVAGKPVATGGWHALFRYLVAHELPRPLSLRSWATLEAGVTGYESSERFPA